MSHSYHISPTAANKHQVNCWCSAIFPLSCAFFIKRKSHVFLCHFTLWSRVKGRVQRLNRSSFHTPTPALAVQVCLWNNLTASCLHARRKKTNTPNCSLLCGVIASFHTIFPLVTADRGVGASSQHLFYDSNSSCHLLSYGRGVGERLTLTPMTWLDLMRTDGTLSVEWHIKQLCHRSAVEFLCKT